MIDPLSTDSNMNNSPVDSILSYDPCTLTKSEKRLYNATINSWEATLRQQRFEACMAMEREAQAVSSCADHTTRLLIVRRNGPGRSSVQGIRKTIAYATAKYLAQLPTSREKWS